MDKSPVDNTLPTHIVHLPREGLQTLSRGWRIRRWGKLTYETCGLVGVWCGWGEDGIYGCWRKAAGTMWRFADHGLNCSERVGEDLGHGQRGIPEVGSIRRGRCCGRTMGALEAWLHGLLTRWLWASTRPQLLSWDLCVNKVKGEHNFRWLSWDRL